MRARLRTRHRLRRSDRRNSSTRHSYSLRERRQRARTLVVVSQREPPAHGIRLEAAFRMAGRGQAPSRDRKSFPIGKGARSLHADAGRQELRQDCAEDWLATLGLLYGFVIPTLSEAEGIRSSSVSIETPNKTPQPCYSGHAHIHC